MSVNQREIKENKEWGAEGMTVWMRLTRPEDYECDALVISCGIVSSTAREQK